MSYDCQKLTEAITSLQGGKLIFDAYYKDGLGNPAKSANLKEVICFDINRVKENLCVSETEAREIFGEDYLGPDEIGQAFLGRVEITVVPRIPFSRGELKRASELGQMLILRVDTATDGSALTMKKIYEMMNNRTKGGGKILYNTGWYEDMSFYTNESPKAAWALVSKYEISDTGDKNYLEQTDEIVEYLKGVFPDNKLPDRYQKAIDEYLSERSEIALLLDSERSIATDRLESLELTQLTRQTPVEAMYDLFLYFQQTGARLLDIRTTSRSDSGGTFIAVGNFDGSGMLVPRQSVDDTIMGYGAALSRTI
jgi:hypothetical protein